MHLRMEMIPHIKNQIGHFKCDVFRQCFEQMDDLKDLYNLVDTAIIDDPPITMRDGGMIKDGFSAEADELRNAKIKEKNGLQSLKAGRKKRQELKILKLSITRYSDITWRLLIHLKTLFLLNGYESRLLPVLKDTLQMS